MIDPILVRHKEGIEKKDYTHGLAPHNLTIDYSEVPLLYFDGSPFMSFYELAMSVVIPLAEDFMIASFEEAIQTGQFKDIASDIIEFNHQEKNHAIQHQLFNDHFATLGVDLSGVIEQGKKCLLQYKTLSHKLQIAAAIETITSILATVVLLDWPKRNIHPAYMKMMSWHSSEELEHRCIAYDLCLRYHGSRNCLSKPLILAFLLRLFIVFILFTIRNLWKRGSLFSLNTVSSLAYTLCHPKGSGARIIRGFLRLFMPDYHPQNEFDRPELNALIVKFEREYGHIRQAVGEPKEK